MNAICIDCGREGGGTMWSDGFACARCRPAGSVAQTRKPRPWQGDAAMSRDAGCPANIQNRQRICQHPYRSATFGAALVGLRYQLFTAPMRRAT